MWSGLAHALFVSFSAGAATVAAVVLTVAAARRGDGRSVMIGTAFAAMAAGSSTIAASRRSRG
jgi:hypothetical protein